MCPPEKRIVQLEKNLAKVIINTEKKSEILVNLSRVIDESPFAVDFFRFDFRKFCWMIDLYYESEAKCKNSGKMLINMIIQPLLLWFQDRDPSKFRALFFVTTPLTDELHQETLCSLTTVTDTVNRVFQDRVSRYASSASFKKINEPDFREFDFFIFAIYESTEGDIKCQFKWDIR